MEREREREREMQVENNSKNLRRLPQFSVTSSIDAWSLLN